MRAVEGRPYQLVSRCLLGVIPALEPRPDQEHHSGRFRALHMREILEEPRGGSALGVSVGPGSQEVEHRVKKIPVSGGMKEERPYDGKVDGRARVSKEHVALRGLKSDRMQAEIAQAHAHQDQIGPISERALPDEVIELAHRVASDAAVPHLEPPALS